MEFDKEPFELGNNKVINHSYEKSGTYDVTGTMFRVARDFNQAPPDENTYIRLPPNIPY